MGKWRSQIATLNMERGKHLKYDPYAFTEGGIAMLSGVLRSPTAIAANIRIMRAFVAMRHALDFHDRFVIIDNAELHNFGSSVNSLGQRVTTYSTRNAKEIKKLLALLP